MGGHGSTGKTKIFSVIGAARNRPFQEARAKELAAERATAKSKPAARGNKKIIDKKGTASVLVRVPGDGSLNGDKFERRNVESFARSKDGNLHITKGGKYSFHVTDVKSGQAVTTFGSKKNAMKFLEASTRADGTTSPVLRRYIENMNTSKADFRALPKEKQKRLSRAFAAVMKVKERIGYD